MVATAIVLVVAIVVLLAILVISEQLVRVVIEFNIMSVFYIVFIIDSSFLGHLSSFCFCNFE